VISVIHLLGVLGRCSKTTSQFGFESRRRFLGYALKLPSQIEGEALSICVMIVSGEIQVIQYLYIVQFSRLPYC